MYIIIYQNHIESMGHEGKHVNDLTKEETERLMNFDADEEYEDIPAEVSGWSSGFPYMNALELQI